MITTGSSISFLTLPDHTQNVLRTLVCARMSAGEKNISEGTVKCYDAIMAMEAQLLLLLLHNIQQILIILELMEFFTCENV